MRWSDVTVGVEKDMYCRKYEKGFRITFSVCKANVNKATKLISFVLHIIKFVLLRSL